MIYFFSQPTNVVFVLQSQRPLSESDVQKLSWLFGGAEKVDTLNLEGHFVGPRATMITPWSTNAVEITQNMAITGLLRIEEFKRVDPDFKDYDPMLSQKYATLKQEIFDINIAPEPILYIEDIAQYNAKEGLSMSDEEVAYLNEVADKLGRKLTDSEVFGFSQINSEHCRHKIFNGQFIIDGAVKESSLFKLIKKTSQANPNDIVSAYKDNVAFIKGPRVQQFAPKTANKPDFYEVKDFDSVISVKAETHNFPTTVEPFNGAATGSGGEIRDRLAGGQGSLPLAGTAVYMTALSRLTADRPWEDALAARKWLYQSPIDILIKASNGASDFGNKFGQPLITGSVLTFEHDEQRDVDNASARQLGYDKVIMLAGGVGYGKLEQAIKQKPQPGDQIVILGGENYRIGMGGAAVSSVDTGEHESGIELNAVQRSNPEMQKRAANTIRAFVESDDNPIISIHDHGAGGHNNCLSELVEETGGKIDVDQLPVGDPTLSLKEILNNESQERIGLVVNKENAARLKEVAERERSPMYIVGEVTGDHRFTFESSKTAEKPMDMALNDMFGSSPKLVMEDRTIDRRYRKMQYQASELHNYLNQVLQLEAVACKDWLTNKVDRCVGGRVAKQQCAGPLQLPLNNCGVMALDYQGKEGIATSVGHAPIAALIDAAAGSRLAIAESLSNLVWAPLKDQLASVSLSANWMWACKNEGEDARLYAAVEACSEFAIQLGINIPTGKDSLSMKQKYNGAEVIAPGTVIISAAGNCSDIRQVVEPVLMQDGGDIYYINLSQDTFKLGGSSLGQVLNQIGDEAPDIKDAAYFKKAFNALQTLIAQGEISAGHDVSSGGLITTLLEMCFSNPKVGASVDLSVFEEADLIKMLFAENPALVIQCQASAAESLKAQGVIIYKLGSLTKSAMLDIQHGAAAYQFDIAALRDVWFKTSFLLDQKQSGKVKAQERFDNYKVQPLNFQFPAHFTGMKPQLGNAARPKAAILREKGSNSEREVANALFLAGFDVKDVHMTDLMFGRENLEDIQFLAAVGGFSNSDVLGSAKGWAGAFLYNENAKTALENFFKREDTLSVGICNGCQLFIELGLLNPSHANKPKMLHNDSAKHESIFTSLYIPQNKSIMLSTLAGSTLGVWVSHGEGKFDLPMEEQAYEIVAKYAYEAYPANPNGSAYNTAMMCDDSGRHLVMMPHIERSLFQWHWANYPAGRQDEVSPWMEAFVNARIWIDNTK